MDLKGHCVYSKKALKRPWLNGGVARRNKRYQCPSHWGVMSLICLLSNSMIFVTKVDKYCITALPRPGPYLRGNPFFESFLVLCCRGFEALIEREWLQAGHPFWSRTTKGPFNDSVASKSKLHSPTFAMFLDCIFQVISAVFFEFRLSSFSYLSQVECWEIF